MQYERCCNENNCENKSYPSGGAWSGLDGAGAGAGAGDGAGAGAGAGVAAGAGAGAGAGMNGNPNYFPSPKIDSYMLI